jgi:hypothetical protein
MTTVIKINTKKCPISAVIVSKSTTYLHIRIPINEPF